MAEPSIPDTPAHDKQSPTLELNISLMFHRQTRRWFASIWTMEGSREILLGSGLTVPSALEDLAGKYEDVRAAACFLNDLEQVQIPR
jgi:hypothetical protein